ncbi:MAG: hypothetical protein E7346_02540 [Clostridiales bacterium]|nr:hypothetical protein [Clostridiales bacterium]
MNSAKMHRILITISASLMALMFALFAVSFISKPNTANAAISASASTYFTGVDKVEFKDDKVVAEITSNDNVLSVKNSLVVGNFEMKLNVPTDKFKSFTMVFTTDTYYANGNVFNAVIDEQDNIIDGELKKQVENRLTVNYETGKYYWNDITDNSEIDDFTSSQELTIAVGVRTDGVLRAKVGDDFIDAVDSAEDCYKVKEVEHGGMSMVVANISFEFALAGGAADFGIVSIDQNINDTNDDHKQEFKTGDLKAAKPRVTVNDDFYLSNGSVKKNVMEDYTLTLTPHSVFGEVTSSDLYLASSNDNVWFEKGTDKPKTVQFCKVGTYNLNICGKDGEVYETISNIDVVDFSEDDEAPVYTSPVDKWAKGSFMLALKEAYYDSENKHHKPLGTSIDLPSLKDFVTDEYSTYEELKYTVYYNTDTKEAATSSTMSLTLSEAGNYNFCVVFTDANGNAMDYKKDFIDGVDGNDPIYKEDFVFNFHVADDAPVSIVAPKSQGVGYVGVNYYASKFTVDAVGCTTTYKLYYNANKEATADSEGWILIPSASSITDQEYDQDGYDYETIQSISYAGGLNFTPDKAGLYMIECSATSSASSRSATAYTFIQVDDEPMEVKVPSTWLKDNVWSVVFLSVGTLCLIGIIILLCIKPKEETEEE